MTADARLRRETAALLDTARKHAGLKRIELARRLGIPPSQVTRLLSGSHNLTLATLVRVAEACGQTVTITLEANA